MIQLSSMKSETGQILQAIQGLSDDVKGLKNEVHGLKDEVRELRVGQEELRTGQTEMRGSIQSLEKGQEELRVGQEELRVGQDELHEMFQEFATHVDQRFDRLEGRVGKIEATMVTKDYLDDKLAEHGARYGEIDRKTNEKIVLLTETLVSESSLSAGSGKRIVSTEPFAKVK